jgi:lipopolysaccharide biosynthesis protein
MEAIAFYLPQYHVIPENEEIYGKNFTEWQNVKSGVPLFDGHYQPHIPHELLGYYDLTDEKTLTLQHHLAYSNGVTGFCYYYYNMAGRTLLEAPLQIINKSRYIENKFCFCWAHPSWYNNIVPNPGAPFIEQRYSAEEARKLIRCLEQYFVNPRYIRIDDKPLLLVFAPERCPEMRVYSEVWREEALRMGFKGLCLAGVEAFLGRRPEAYGFDCMVEFAPNWRKENNLSRPGDKPRRIDYVKTVTDMLMKAVPDYTRLRCAFPSWDNTTRVGEHGIAFVNMSPGAFEVMMEKIAEYTRAHLPANMQYLFINAWNEWGEGCHLEPDKKYGFELLHIVRDVLKKY